MKDAARDTAHRASRQNLVLENIFCLSIQLVSELVDSGYLVFESCSGRIAEQTSDRFSDERCPIRCDVVDLFREIVGNRDVYAHTIKVRQECVEGQRRGLCGSNAGYLGHAMMGLPV
jgi:hypothetical protein